MAAAEDAGLAPEVRHLANSAADPDAPGARFDLVRPGSRCYGLARPGADGRDLGLRPAMTVQSPLALAKRVPAGTGVSYGHT